MAIDPVTLALVFGAGALAGVGGFVAGRRGAPAPEVASPVAPVAAVDPRMRELEAELSALREAAALPPAERLRGELMGAEQPFLRELLSEVLTHKVARAACVIDAQGLIVCGEDRDGGQQALAALVAGARAAGVEPWQLRWEDERGNILELFQLTSGRRQPLLYLGVWSKGLEVPRSVASRARYMCAGASREAVGGSGARLQVKDDRGARALRQIAEAAPLKRVRVQQGHAVLADMLEGSAGMDDAAVLKLWAWSHSFGKAREALGLGAVSALALTSMARRTVGLHAFASAQGAPCVLWLEQSAQESYPWSLISSWTGQLSWQIQSLIMAPDPAPADLPRPMKSPDTARMSR